MADIAEEQHESITSPRHLQEMSLPNPDGHDLTAASGISMRQYEEQLSALRKENFNMRLRIYFLEEKLESGAAPTETDLLKHNLELQVQLEELRRQLAEKQELLAAAAEAIDAMEHQGSISTDSVEASFDRKSAALRKELLKNNTEPLATEDDTCHESGSAGDCLVTSTDNDGINEMARLRREHRKALLMIKSSTHKILAQERDLKKLRLNEEIMKCKDEHIRDLESKVMELQKSAESANDDGSGNLQELLTRRLQGLAYFLDKLLSHKCVLGEEKKKLAASILEQSLALPVGLKLDESMAPEYFTMDESNLDLSQSMRIEDLTLMFGHHVTCSDENRYSGRKALRHVPQVDAISESECWSEPDRNVSLARIGLKEAANASADHTSELNRHKSRRSRISHGSRSEDCKNTSECNMLEEIVGLKQQIEQLESDKNDLNQQLESANELITCLVTEKDDLKTVLVKEQESLTEASKSLEAHRIALQEAEAKAKDIEQQRSHAVHLIEKLRSEKQELETAFAQTEHSLRRAADEATVQASQALLERARAHHERLRVERELEETREKLASALETTSQLQIEAAQRVAADVEHRFAAKAGHVDGDAGHVIADADHAAADAAQRLAALQEVLSEEERPTSPDQGIDSDRLSSLEQNDASRMSPRSLYEENISLKRKLARSKTAMAEMLQQLNESNLKKISVQRAICREIHKTQGVLRQARTQFETPP